MQILHILRRAASAAYCTGYSANKYTCRLSAEAAQPGRQTFLATPLKRSLQGRQGVLVYCNSLSQACASLKKLCTSADKARASGKALSFSCAGTGTGSGQATAGGVGVPAHPLSISAQVNRLSERLVALFPRGGQRRRRGSLFLTVLLLKRLSALCVVLPQFGNTPAIERRGVLVSTDENGHA